MIILYLACIRMGQNCEDWHLDCGRFLAGAELFTRSVGLALDSESTMLSLTTGAALQLSWVDRPYGFDLL